MLSVRLSDPGQRLRTVRQLAGKKSHTVRQTLLAVAVTALCVSGSSVATHAARYSSSPAHTAATRPAPPLWFRGNPCTYRSQLWRVNQRLANLIADYASKKNYSYIYQVVISNSRGLGRIFEVANAHGVSVNTPGPSTVFQLKPAHSDVYTRAMQTILTSMLALGDAAGEVLNSSPAIHRLYPRSYHLAVVDNARAWKLLKQIACAR
jgi:hypothetical protein